MTFIYQYIVNIMTLIVICTLDIVAIPICIDIFCNKWSTEIVMKLINYDYIVETSVYREKKYPYDCFMVSSIQ